MAQDRFFVIVFSRKSETTHKRGFGLGEGVGYIILKVF